MLFFSKINLRYWPIFSCSWCISTFIITYILSICNGHVYPFFPYISDTGTKPPESCIFGQMLNIATVLLGITVYLRYKQLEIAISRTDNVIGSSWNLFSLPLGIVSCMGISVVANFQETNIFQVHMIGAFMIFCGGMIYFVMQARIAVAFGNLADSIYGVKKCLVYFRVFVAACLVPLFFITSICATVSGLQFTGESIEYWTEEDGGFTLRLIGTFSEWIAVILMMTFLATYTVELETIKFKGLSVESAK